MTVTMLPGRSFVVSGEDAHSLRRMLCDGDDHAGSTPGADAEPPAPDDPDERPEPAPQGTGANAHGVETLTGHGPGPLVRRTGDETRVVAP